MASRRSSSLAYSSDADDTGAQGNGGASNDWDGFVWPELRETAGQVLAFAQGCAILWARCNKTASRLSPARGSTWRARRRRCVSLSSGTRTSRAIPIPVHGAGDATLVGAGTEPPPPVTAPMTGLSLSRAWVSVAGPRPTVGPPLSARGPSMESMLCLSPVALKPQVAPLSRLLACSLALPRHSG